MKNQLTLASLSWGHLLNYGNSHFQLVTLEHEILSIPIAQSWKVVQRNNGSPNYPLHVCPNNLKVLHVTPQFLSKLPLERVLLFTHHHHFVPIVQHFSPPNPIVIIKPLSKPLISSSFSSTSPYTMQHDLFTFERGQWHSRRTKPSTLKITWN
jgi:hypothetical protein